MRNRNTLELIGIWEELNNPDIIGNEFVTFKTQAGLNSFNLTPKKWISATNALGMISKAGNIRDHTSLEQLVVLSNLEGINAVMIQQGLSQGERLKQLNQITIMQMKSLLGHKTIRKLE